MQNRVIAILGCTASGKGSLGRALATHLDAEIISVDSMKVYRGMDIGTAKPSAQQRGAIPHHLIDVADPWESFSAAEFVARADQAVLEIHARGRPALLVGGSVLYFKCFLHGLFEGPAADWSFRTRLRERIAREGLDALHQELQRRDPAAAQRIHSNDARRIERALEVLELSGAPISAQQQQWVAATLRRPEWHWTLLGLRHPREIANRRINERVRRMIELGLPDEARRLAADPRGVSPQARQAVGYAELFEHFAGRATLDEAIERIKINSRRIAKQQRSWFKRFTDVHWLEGGETDDVTQMLSDASNWIERDADPRSRRPACPPA